MMHFGHANALRQARELGDYLIVGVHSDEAILKNKGPTVMKEEERYKAVAACKWVDEVVKDAPYVTDVKMLEDYNVDFCVHGDDLVTASDGTDCYAAVKAAGKFKVVKRTSGVSTTDLVGRMLLLTKTHFVKRENDGTVFLEKRLELETLKEFGKSRRPTTITQFNMITKRIDEFSSSKQPHPNDKVVYIDGSFDLFHVGHIMVLEKAKKQGDYLIVGIYDDQTVNQYQGKNLPIMNVYERCLGVLSCRFVDEVVIGAPLEISKDFIDSLKINVVCCGTTPHSYTNLKDTYKVPKELGILATVESPSKLTTPAIIDRILENHKDFEARNKKKEEKEMRLIGHTFTT